jgi:acyl dehydratase
MSEAGTQPAGPLYFEDLALESQWRSGSRTVTEADVVAFAGVSGDFNPIHTSAVHAAETSFGQRIAHGALILAIATGLRQQEGRFRGTLKAWLGMSEWRFKAPVLIGDTVTVVNRIVGLKARAGKGDGLVTQRVSVINQREELVAEGDFLTLMLRREATG